MKDTAPNKITLLTSITCIVFAAAFAIYTGSRLNEQALAVVAGAVCGVGATLPPSLLIIAVILYRQQTPHQPTAQTYPPVVVVAPQGQQIPAFAPQAQGQHTYLNHQPQPRSFTIVGEE